MASLLLCTSPPDKIRHQQNNLDNKTSPAGPGQRRYSDWAQYHRKYDPEGRLQFIRKTRAVLTSNDPDYRRKLLAITRILRRLGPTDRFFSVDEYGPFSIKHHGGRCKVRNGEYPTVPQYQVSKGRLIVTAALELSTNQVTHFYSHKKDTGEMITLLRMLLKAVFETAAEYIFRGMRRPGILQRSSRLRCCE